MEQYYFISDFGKMNLPSKSGLHDFNQKNGQMLFVLDSCVCLDIVNMVKWKAKSKFDKTKIFNLIEYAQKNKISQLSIYALVESCYDRKTLEIQPEKLFDFQNKINFAFQTPIKKLKKFDFNFDDYIFNSPKVSNDVVCNIIDHRVNIFYAGLLKICEISQKGLKIEQAEKNVTEFVDWMENDLDVILGIEYSLALKIFGGDSRFRSMLKIGSSKDKVMKAAWGTAWDLFHAKASCHREQISELVDKNVYPIFTTNDSTLFELISNEVNSYVRYEHLKLSLIKRDIPKIYSDKFIDELNNRFLELNKKRIHKNTNRETDVIKIKFEIQKIENCLIL